VAEDCGVKLRDPETCPRCQATGRFRVIDSRRRAGYRRKILRCRECGQKWPAFFTLVDPRRAIEAMADWQRALYTVPRSTM